MGENPNIRIVVLRFFNKFEFKKIFKSEHVRTLVYG